MPIKKDLLSELSSVLEDNGRLVLHQNVQKVFLGEPPMPRPKAGLPPMPGPRPKAGLPPMAGPPPLVGQAKLSIFYVIISIVLISLIVIFFIYIVKYFDLKSYNNELSVKPWSPGFFLMLLLLILISYIIRWLYRQFVNKSWTFKIENLKVYPELSEQEDTNEAIKDEVYTIITESYNSLSIFRIERERQARFAFNAALALIIVGIIIVFFGVFLLFAKKITEGSVTASIGAISNIIGGTILSFYRNTNDRIDKLNSDLFILNTAKVQYAIILRINDTSKRDVEMAKLVNSIGHIKKQ